MFNGYGSMDGAIERLAAGEGPLGEMMGFEIVSDNFDAVEVGAYP